MKKFLFAVLVMCLSLSLAACGQKLDENSELTTKPIEAENTTAATLPTDYDSVPEALTTEFGTEQQGNSNESGNDFQRQFKADSIKEFFTVLDGIRTGITFNREHVTEKMIVEQAVTLICWSRGTTLTSDEIEAEWKNYTSGWEKGEYLSFATFYDLVYDECSKIVSGDDNDTLAELGYSYSDFLGLQLPLEPMESIYTLEDVAAVRGIH